MEAKPRFLPANPGPFPTMDGYEEISFTGHFQKKGFATEPGVTKMGSGARDDQYGVLKWKDYHVTVASSFKMLKDEEDFLDVTLVCDEESQLSAHKVGPCHPPSSHNHAR